MIIRSLCRLCCLASLTIAGWAATANVTVGVNGGPGFVDSASGNSTTTIHIGDSVLWNWSYYYYGPPVQHSTTSGTCSSTTFTCTADGRWDSTLNVYPHTFSQTFNTAGTYHYYCLNHTVYMQGTVVVLPKQQAGVQRLRLLPANSTLAVNASTNFTALLGFFQGAGKTGGREQDVTAKIANWTSSNTAVATVNAATGQVTGVSAGSTVISASFDRFQAATTLTVQ